MSRRSLLLVLSALVLVALALGWLTLAGVFGPVSPTVRLALLSVLVILTVFVATGWVVVLWERRQRSRAEPQDAEPVQTMEDLLALSPSEFEAWVQRLFRSRGYFTHNTPDTGDHGVDLWVVSPQGERAVVQCKRYRSVVGEAVVRDLFGVMQHEGAPRGFLVTTGGISAAAERWVRDKPIELIDGARLALLAAGRVDPSEPLASKGVVIDG